MVRTWKRRWFSLRVLPDGSGRLDYWPTMADAKTKKEAPISHIDLSTALSIASTGEQSSSGFPFEIVTPNRSYLLMASSADERFRWIESLRTFKHENENAREELNTLRAATATLSSELDATRRRVNELSDEKSSLETTLTQAKERSVSVEKSEKLQAEVDLWRDKYTNLVRRIQEAKAADGGEGRTRARSGSNVSLDPRVARSVSTSSSGKSPGKRRSGSRTSAKGRTSTDGGAPPLAPAPPVGSGASSKMLEDVMASRAGLAAEMEDLKAELEEERIANRDVAVLIKALESDVTMWTAKAIAEETIRKEAESRLEETFRALKSAEATLESNAGGTETEVIAAHQAAKQATDTLSKAREQASSAERRAAEAEAALNAERLSSGAEIAGLHEAAAKASREMDSLRARLATAEAGSGGAQALLDEEIKARKAAEASLASTEQEVDGLRARLGETDRMAAKIASLELDLAHAQTQVKNLEGEMEEKDATIAHLRTASVSANDQVIAKMRSQLDAKISAVASRDAALEEMKTALAEAEAEAQQARDEGEAATEELRALRREIATDNLDSFRNQTGMIDSSGAPRGASMSMAGYRPPMPSVFSMCCPQRAPVSDYSYTQLNDSTADRFNEPYQEGPPRTPATPPTMIRNLPDQPAVPAPPS